VIDPIAFEVGPLAVHWYGIIIASAVLLAAGLGTLEAKRRGEDIDAGWSMLLWVLLTGVIGARVYHVIHQWDFYAANPALIPQLWNGGLSITGAVIGGVIGIVGYTRWYRMPTARWFDIFATPLLLGQAVGRLGNFVNQELYGPPTDLPWGIPISAPHRVGEWTNLAEYPVDTTFFHPLFAYEALLSLLGLAVILYVSRRFASRLYDGDVFLIWLVWYGVVRAILENFRTDNWVIAGVPTAIWIGVGQALLAGGFLWLRHARGWGTPGAWMDRSEKAPPEPDGSPVEAGAG
jgi:phosphatidylglycerol---prolipoprotein diacylglyceryl transferase